MELEYGPILVVKGRHKGRVGYYDDEANGVPMVYFGEFLGKNVVFSLISHKNLIQLDGKQARKFVLNTLWPETKEG